MLSSDFLRRWFGPRPGTIRKTTRRQSSLEVKPQLEELETRLVMTANVSLTAGVLKAVCDNKATTVTLSHSGTTTTLAGKSFADATISRIEIIGGGGKDTVLVRGTPSVPVLVNAGGGDDVIQVGSTSNLLSSVQGDLAVRGTTGIDSLVLHDEGSTVGRTYTVTATSVSRSGAARITYSDTTESVRLEVGLGNDQVRVNSLPTVSGIVVNGGAGVNSLVGPVADTAWQVNQMDGGSLNAGAVSFSNFANLTGGAGADTFLLGDGQGVSGVLDGGGGVNTLDYGAFTTGVSVNLTDGTATNVADGIRNIQNALGGVGDDVLVGTEGDNVLDGRDGVDQLDGRGGNDTLLNGEDPPPVARVKAAYNTADRILRVEGTEGDDNIQVYQEGSLIRVVADGTPIDITVIDGDHVSTVPELSAEQVDHTEAQALGGQDRVEASSQLGDPTPRPVVIYGGAGDDLIYGGLGNDSFYGGAGNDTIYAEAGDDTMEGGADSDSIYGQAGDDLMIGGDSTLLPGNGDLGDYLEGGAGRDIMFGQEGDDTMFGGDNFFWSEGWDVGDHMEGGAGSDAMYGQDGDDTMFGGDNLGWSEGSDLADTMDGGADSDFMGGQGGDDILYGQEGDDTLLGHEGNDQVHGGADNDWLEAGSAAEFADGGTGTDWNAHVWAINGVAITDVDQVGSPTCSFLSSLAGATQYYNLANNISYEGNYTYAVRLFDPALNQWVTERVRFDGTMIFDSTGELVDPRSVTEGEFWTVVYQRAYLRRFYHINVYNGDTYDDFDLDGVRGGGEWPDQPLRAITGEGAQLITAGAYDPWALRTLAWNETVTACDTVHCYMLFDVYQDGQGQVQVVLYNPWAEDKTHETSLTFAADGSDDGFITVAWDVFRNNLPRVYATR